MGRIGSTGYVLPIRLSYRTLNTVIRVSNLKRPACASKRDGLVLATIRYAAENGSDTNATFMTHSWTHCYESQHCSRHDYKYYIDGIVLFIVAIFGITGTLMSVAVLFKPQLQNPFTKLLTFLCFFDCTFLIMAIFYISLPSLSCCRLGNYISLSCW